MRAWYPERNVDKWTYQVSHHPFREKETKVAAVAAGGERVLEHPWVLVWLFEGWLGGVETGCPYVMQAEFKLVIC